MRDSRTNTVLMWVAIITLSLSVLGEAINGATRMGALEENVKTLNKISDQSVQRPEWVEFATDIQRRLERIEDKIDAQGRK